MVQVDEFFFRRFQVVEDLKHVARRAQQDGFDRIAAAVPGAAFSSGQLRDALDRIIDGEGRIPEAIVDDLHPCLLLAATLPRDHELAFESATAILLADRIQGGTGTDSLEWHWSAFAPHYRAADPAVRSALMHGYGLCRDMKLVKLTGAPRGADLITQDRQTVHRALLALARRMTRDEAASVARSAEDAVAVLRRKRLEAVLPEGLFPVGDPEFPLDAMQRHALSPEAPAFVPCLALLCLNTIAGRIDIRQLGDGWHLIGPALSALPNDRGRPLVLGIRHLFETRRDWRPYEDAPSQTLTAIPWTNAIT